MSLWSAIGSWAVGQFADNFLSGDKKDGSIMDRFIGAGASALSDKFLGEDAPSKRGRPPNVDLGVTSAKTYAMSDAKGPSTPEVVDHSLVEAEWTRIAKKLADIQDTSSRVG